jgi:hypothetical protein
MLKISTNPKKKYMIKINYDNKIKTIHFGANGYKDYTIYYKDEGKEFADKRKALYINRHKNDNLNDVFSPGFWSRWVLWGEPTIKESLKKILTKYPSIKLEKIE